LPELRNADQKSKAEEPMLMDRNQQSIAAIYTKEVLLHNPIFLLSE
jgi:hypothetical protein